jgi:hypothetical protein
MKLARHEWCGRQKMKSEPSVGTINFENGWIARVVKAKSNTHPEHILKCFELDQTPKGVISISGGARAYPSSIIPQTEVAMQALIKYAFKNNIALIDGGTATGVMQVIGKCFARTRRSRPKMVIPLLVGFVPDCMVTYPGAKKQHAKCLTRLDPNHPYFVLLEDVQEWGDEVDSMFRFIEHLACQIPSIAIVANGGLTTLKEAMVDVAHGREIIVLEGSHRAGEAIIGRMDGVSRDELVNILYRSDLVTPENPNQIPSIIAKLDTLVESGYLTRFKLGSSPSDLVNLVASRLMVGRFSETDLQKGHR